MKIERIEVVKGEAARRLFGDGAENGVIQIFTKEPEASEPEEPSANDAPSPGRGSEEQISATSPSRNRQNKPIEVAYYVRLGSPAFVLATNELSLVVP